MTEHEAADTTGDDTSVMSADEASATGTEDAAEAAETSEDGN